MTGPRSVDWRDLFLWDMYSELVKHGIRKRSMPAWLDRTVSSLGGQSVGQSVRPLNG